MPRVGIVSRAGASMPSMDSGWLILPAEIPSLFKSRGDVNVLMADG